MTVELHGYRHSVYARFAQIVAIIDSDGYWPMVRQVYAHRIFRPMEGANGLAGHARLADSWNGIAERRSLIDGGPHRAAPSGKGAD